MAPAMSLRCHPATDQPRLDWERLGVCRAPCRAEMRLAGGQAGNRWNGTVHTQLGCKLRRSYHTTSHASQRRRHAAARLSSFTMCRASLSGRSQVAVISIILHCTAILFLPSASSSLRHGDSQVHHWSWYASFSGVVHQMLSRIQIAVP